MKITDIKVIPVDDNTRLKAFVTIMVDECMVIRDVKVIEGNSRLFIAMPAKKLRNGSYQDVAHPLDFSTREMFEREVLNEYRRTVGEESEGFKPSFLPR